MTQLDPAARRDRPTNARPQRERGTLVVALVLVLALVTPGIAAAETLTSDALKGVSCVLNSSKTECISVGQTEKHSLAEYFNGTKWSTQETPTPETGHYNVVAVSCYLASSHLECVAVGNYAYTETKTKTLVETWNGTSWKVATSASPGENSQLNGVSCSGTNKCHAVGSNSAGTLIENESEGAFAQETSPNPKEANTITLSSVSCNGTEGCQAVGSYVRVKGLEKRSRMLIEGWNGKEWSIETAPFVSEELELFLKGVACTAIHACKAVGYSQPGSKKEDVTIAFSWNGTEWKKVTSESPGVSSQLLGVSCNAFSGKCLTAGRTDAESETKTLAESEVAGNFVKEVTPNPTEFSRLSAISCVSVVSSCEAVGVYEGASGAKTLAEGWNGKEWTVQETPSP